MGFLSSGGATKILETCVRFVCVCVCVWIIGGLPRLGLLTGRGVEEEEEGAVAGGSDRGGTAAADWTDGADTGAGVGSAAVDGADCWAGERERERKRKRRKGQILA